MNTFREVRLYQDRLEPVKSLLLSLFLFTASGLTGIAAAERAPKVAVAAFTFHTFSVFETVERTAQAGAHYLETFTNQALSPADPTKIYATSPAQRALLRAHLAKHGVEIISCMGAVAKDEAKARAFFDLAVSLGARNIGTDSVDSLGTIEKIIGDYPLTVSFHNHARDPKKPEYRNYDPAFIRDLLKNRHPRLGVCADTGHYATSGVVPLEAIKMLAGRINSVHLKERAAIGSRTPDLVYGTGITATVDILAELRRQRFDGLLVIEYEVNPRNNLAEVKQCVEFLREHLKTQ